jgi:hypothetical protein
LKNLIANKITFFLGIIFFTFFSCRTLKEVEKTNITDKTITERGHLLYSCNGNFFESNAILILSKNTINIKIISEVGFIVANCKIFNDSIVLSGLFTDRVVITDTSKIIRNLGIAIHVNVFKNILLNIYDENFQKTCFQNNLMYEIIDTTDYINHTVNFYDLKQKHLLKAQYHGSLPEQGFHFPKEILLYIPQNNANLKLNIQTVTIN